MLLTGVNANLLGANSYAREPLPHGAALYKYLDRLSRTNSGRRRLNLNIHVHSLVLDGVYTRPSASTPPRFPRRLVAALTEPPALQRLLAALGLAAEPPPRPPVTVEPVPSAASLARPSRPGRRSRLGSA